MTRRTVRILEITRDPRLQIRESMNAERIEEYASAYREAPAESRPSACGAVELVSDGDHLWLVDGWHRLPAAEAAGVPEILANVRDGSFADARLAAAGANTRHGLNRSAETKRRAVLVLLGDPVWRSWADKAIAQHCGVRATFVAELRASAHFDDTANEETGTYTSGGSRDPPGAQVLDLSSSRPPHADKAPADLGSLARAGRRIGSDGKRYAAKPATVTTKTETIERTTTTRVLPDRAELERERGEEAADVWRDPDAVDPATQADADAAAELFSLCGRIVRLLDDRAVVRSVLNETRARQVLEAHARVHGAHDWQGRLGECAVGLTELLQVVTGEPAPPPEPVGYIEMVRS